MGGSRGVKLQIADTFWPLITAKFHNNFWSNFGQSMQKEPEIHMYPKNKHYEKS